MPALDFPTSPAVDEEHTQDKLTYVWKGEKWNRKTAETKPLELSIGDIKNGFQVYDHNGWIKLDGRATSLLSDSQKSAAASLGFTVNLPDATDSVLLQKAGGAMGEVDGSWVLAQANLPAVNLASDSKGAHTHTAASAGAHTHVTDSQGGHTHKTFTPNFLGFPGALPSTQDAGDITLGAHTHTAQSAGAHTHATDSQGNHTHSIPLGGSATPIKPKAMNVNTFVYLGV